MKNILVIIAAIVLSFWAVNIVVLVTVSQAAGVPDFQKVLEGAKREGKLVIWVSTPAREKTHQLLLEAFCKRFGLQTRWEWIAIHPTQSTPRVITEASAGRVNADVMAPASDNEILSLIRANLTKPYPWVEVFESHLPGIREAAETGVKEFRGIGLSWFDNAYGVAWNTKMIEDSKIPDRLEQLGNPQWQGKLIINVGGAAPFDTLSLEIGREKAIELIRKIVAVRPVLKKGTPAVTSALTIGEAPVALGSFFNSERAIMNGEPVKFKFFEDYIPVRPLYAVVPEGSPNPNTARLFAAWAATEGMPIFEQEEVGGRVNDPRSRLAKFIKERAGKAKLIFPKSLKEVEQADSISQEITIITTGGR
jgi:iron(III) transport system substrate-binding protein